jgi:hypothetical protein
MAVGNDGTRQCTVCRETSSNFYKRKDGTQRSRCKRCESWASKIGNYVGYKQGLGFPECLTFSYLGG